MKQEICEFTTDKLLINKYFRLRRAVYNLRDDVPELVNLTDKFDESSDFIVLRKTDGSVISGVRLTMSTNHNVLPMEDDGKINLRENFKYIPFEKISYGEVGKIIICPDYLECHRSCLAKLFDKIKQRALIYDCHLLFAKVTLPAARLYKKIGNDVGIIIDYDESSLFDYNFSGKPVKKTIASIYRSVHHKKIILNK